MAVFAGVGVRIGGTVGVLGAGDNNICSLLVLVSSTAAIRVFSSEIIITERAHKSKTRIIITIIRIVYSDLSETSLGGIIKFLSFTFTSRIRVNIFLHTLLRVAVPDQVEFVPSAVADSWGTVDAAAILLCVVRQQWCLGGPVCQR